MAFVTALEAVRRISDDLFVVELPDSVEIVFRLPTCKQASQYGQILTVAEDNGSLQGIVYEHVFSEYVEDKYLAVHDSNLKAGVPETIAKLILFLSGADANFKDYTESLLEAYRSQTSSFLSIMKRTVCRTFSGYKISDLEDLNFQELVKVYVEAEKVLLDEGIMEEGLKFVEPEEAKPFSVENIISKDTRDYHGFEHDGPNQKLTDDHAYKAKMEEFRVKQKLREMRRGG